MKPVKFALLCLALAACQEEQSQSTAPVALNPDAVGHFCQMNLLEHDGPKAQVHLYGLPQAPLFFSQVRDAIAYQRLPEQSHEILAIWVNDMADPKATWSAPGSENWIDASDAIYVVGSATLGGMGAPEIVPFSDKEAARAFASENGGVLSTLDDIPDAAVLTPVDLVPDSDEDAFRDRLRALSDEIGD